MVKFTAYADCKMSQRVTFPCSTLMEETENTNKYVLFTSHVFEMSEN